MPRALVAIDLQNEFLSPEGRFPIDDISKHSLLTNLHALIPEFRKHGHIVWIKSNYTNASAHDETESPPDTTSTDSDAQNAFLAGTHTGRSPCCEKGSVNAEFVPEVSNLIDDHSDAVLVKTCYSAFKETSLLEDLRRKRVTDVYFCGLLTNICVLASVLDALKVPELSVHVVEDCLGWRRQTSHQKALDKMGALDVKLVKGSDILGSTAEVVPCEGALSVPELYYVNGSIPSWRVQLALYEKVRLSNS
jgi:nicotinamidase-related amidase